MYIAPQNPKNMSIFFPKKQSIAIPQPCHESWEKMIANAEGKFCLACQKSVIDFTNKSDSEIVEILQKGGNICGRFRKEQLKTYTLEKANWSLPIKAFAVFMAGLATTIFSPNEAIAQGEVIHLEQREETIQKNKERGILREREVFEKNELLEDSLGQVLIKGRVFEDYDMKLGAPAIGIVIKGTQNGTTTDFDGNFEIKIKKTDVLVCSFVGYLTQEIAYAEFVKNPNIILEGSFQGMIYSPPPFHKRIWYKFTDLFRKKENKRYKYL